MWFAVRMSHAKPATRREFVPLAEARAPPDVFQENNFMACSRWHRQERRRGVVPPTK